MKAKKNSSKANPKDELLSEEISRKKRIKEKPKKTSKPEINNDFFSDDAARKKRMKDKPKYNNKKYWLEQDDEDFDDEDLKDFLSFKDEEE